MTKLISRSEALAKGLKKYFTGVACKHGHVDERFVINGRCFTCATLSHQRWAAAHPHLLRESGRKHDAKRGVEDYEKVRKVNRLATLKYRLKSYGLTIEAYQQMMHDQDHKCLICRDPFSKTPHVDHCHTTGKVRGLLCTHCNSMLGHARDNTDTLSRAIAYLTSTE